MELLMVIIALVAITLAILPVTIALSRHREDAHRQRQAMQRWAAAPAGPGAGGARSA